MLTDKQLKAVAMPGDFIFHSSWFEIFKSFDMQTAYTILIAMINYVQTGAVPADEELRRLTVFLFAHIDSDRERLLSLQPKRRTATKKKAAEQAIEPTSPSKENPESTFWAEPQPLPAHTTDISDTSVTSDTSATTYSTYNSHDSHNTHKSHTARRARLFNYAQKVAATIRQDGHRHASSCRRKH